MKFKRKSTSVSLFGSSKESFMLGYNKMLGIIEPSAILCYDEPFKQMRGNIKEYLPTTYEWTKSLDWKDKAKFIIEKHTRNRI